MNVFCMLEEHAFWRGTKKILGPYCCYCTSQGASLGPQYPLPTSVSCEGGVGYTGTDGHVTIKCGYVPLALHFP